MRFLNQPAPTFAPNAVIGLDIETSMRTGKKHSDPFQEDLLSIQISDGTDTWIFSDPNLYRSQIVPLVENLQIIKVIQNAGFDLQFLMHQLGAKPPKDSIYDTLLVERILNSGRTMNHALDDILARRLGVFVDKSIRDSFRNHHGDFSEEQLAYMEGDVLHLPKIYALQIEDIAKIGVGRVVRLENRLTVAVTRMTLRGVCFDTKLWPKYLVDIDGLILSIENELTDMLNLGGQQDLFGGTRLAFNPQSTKQAKIVLNENGIDVPDTNEKTLAHFRETHPTHPNLPLIVKIIEHREWMKRKGWSWQDEINPVSGRIHATWNQVGPVTGRFSCKDPNLQNVPRPEEGKPNLRALFPPAEGYLMAVADYNQQEPRILGQLSEDPALREACNSSDVYAAMAKMTYGEEVDKKDPRRYGIKQVVLASFYGGSAETISRIKGIPIPQVVAIQEKSQKIFRKTYEHMSRIKNMASKKGITRSLLGRPRFYEDIEAGRPPLSSFWNECVNHPVQSSGADALKMGLDYFDDVCVEHGWDAGAVLVVHDEIVAEAKEDIAEEVYHNLIGCMEQAGLELCPDVPLIADGVISKGWDKT